MNLIIGIQRKVSQLYNTEKTRDRNSQNTILYVLYEKVVHFTSKLNKNIQCLVVVTKLYLAV